MKKSLFLTAAIATVLASCSQDETVEMNNGKGITFQAFTDLPTRAADVTQDNLSGFHVWALQEQKTSGLASATVAWQDDYSVSKGAVSGGSTHYWPGDGSNLHFFAYNKEAINSNKVCGGTVNITTGKHQITDVKPAAKASEQKDLVVAYKSGNQDNPGKSPVELNFIHALSKVSIKAKHDVANLTLKIRGVRIYGVNTKATLTLPENTTTGTKLNQNKWSPAANKGGDLTMGNKYTSDPADFSKATDIIISKDADATSIMQKGDEAFMILPQQLTAWGKTDLTSNKLDGAYIAVLCQANQDNYQLFPAGDSNKGKYAWTAIPINTNWEPGKSYTYVLDFTNGGGYIPPTDPDDSGKDPIVPPTDPVNPGDNAWGSAITFTVTVDNWGNATEVETPMGGTN